MKKFTLIDLVGPASRRVEAVGNLDGVLVVALLLPLLSTPLGSDLGEDGTSVLHKKTVGDRVRDGGVDRVEGTSEALVQEAGRSCSGESVPSAGFVAGLLCDEVEDVSTNIPATKVVQVPVGLDGSDLGVMVVESGVSAVVEACRNSISKDDSKYSVACSMCKYSKLE